MPLTLIIASASLLLMLAAFYFCKYRYFHIPAMVVVITTDLLLPIYIYINGNWYERLIEKEEIFSFIIWMHFGLIISLYVLYGAQIYTAVKLLKGQPDMRQLHRMQGKSAVLIKCLVVLSGAVLVE